MTRPHGLRRHIGRITLTHLEILADALARPPRRPIPKTMAARVLA